MQTMGYYGGERASIGTYDPQSLVDPLEGEPEETVDAPEPLDGKLHRYGKVIVTSRSKKRFTFESADAAGRVISWARER